MNTRENDEESGDKPVGYETGYTSKDGTQTYYEGTGRKLYRTAVHISLYAFKKTDLITGTPLTLNAKCPGCIKTDTLYKVMARALDINHVIRSAVCHVCNDCLYQLSNGDAAIAVTDNNKVLIIRPIKETL